MKIVLIVKIVKMKLINKETLEVDALDNADNGNPFDQEFYTKKRLFKEGAEYAENKILPQVYEMLTWASINNYEPIHDGRWCKRFMSITISSEELFNKWLNEKT